jgi:DNA polymerase I-like protein with 3'-5' exonuclease and polymerase domains
MKRICLDIETDGFDPSHIWCVGTEDVDTGETRLFLESDRLKFREFMRDVEEVLGFNVLQFDLPILDSLWGVRVPVDQVTDVLILCQLEQPGREGGNSLEAWGGRLRFPKMDMEKEDFYRGYTEDMGIYCMNDVKLTVKLYHHITSVMSGRFSKDSIRLEHQVKAITSRQEVNGFYLDEFKAMSLSADFSERLTDITEKMQEIFPPKEIQLKTKVKYEPFNPGSRKQIAERLMERGWVPEKHTEKGNVVVDETTLASIDMDEAKVLAEYLMLQKRAAQVKSWLEAIKPKTGRVHGRVLTLQTITGRMAHASPNMAQVPAVYSPYGAECRGCWTVPSDKKVLVGIDASSIELRMLCHYMKDEDYTTQVVSGDIHTYNQQLAELPSRDQAKTFIYALLYGAGAAKIGSIIGKGAAEGQQIMDRFFLNLSSFQDLKTKVNKAAERGWIAGLDKRTLHIRTVHASLNTLLQGGSAILMKRALVIFDKLIKEQGLNAIFVANVHDEWQLEVDKDHGDMVGKLGVDAIKRAGDYYKLRCPLDGEYKVGTSWAETH